MDTKYLIYKVTELLQRRIHFEITIPKAIIKHIEEMAARDKVTLLKFNNIAGVIYDNDWISGVEYEDKNEYYIEEYQEN